MKLYLAGPIFATPERTWNAEVGAALRDAGHELFLPQEKEPGLDDAGIFAADKAGIDWSDGLVAIMDGPDPDAGTCWEVGYAFGTKKSIVLIRTDFRVLAGSVGGYNPMLSQAATIRLNLPAASTTEVVSAILEALGRIEAGPGRPGPTTQREFGTPLDPASPGCRYVEGALICRVQRDLQEPLRMNSRTRGRITVNSPPPHESTSPPARSIAFQRGSEDWTMSSAHSTSTSSSV